MAVTTTIDGVDLKRSCRICLIKYEPENLFCLFGTNKMFQDLSIASAVLDCFGIELKQDKEHPSYVCIKCASTTLQSYTFKKCLVKCQGILKKQLEAGMDTVQTNDAVDIDNDTKDFQGMLYNYLQQAPISKQQEKENNKITLIETDSSEVSSSFNVPSLHSKKDLRNFINSPSSLTALVDHNYSKVMTVVSEIDSNPLDISESDFMGRSGSELLQNRNENKPKTPTLKTTNKVKILTLQTNSPNINRERTPVNNDDKWWLKSLGPPYECRICGRKYGNSFRPFYMHVRAHRVHKLSCKHCGKRFKRDKLIIHMRSHTNEKPYQCSQCPSRFTIPGNLKRHFRCHTGERLYVCDVCGKAYTQATTLNSHKQRHVGKTQYVCAYCGKTFTSDSGHRSHVSKHHNQEKSARMQKFQEEESGGQRNQTKKYKCENCSRDFKTMMALHIHSRSHTNRKTYNCDLCVDTRYTLFYNYEVHMFWHQVQMWEPSTVESIKCKYCDQVFSDKNELTVHVQNHMERSFSCTSCNKSFFNKVQLRYHMRQHNGERPYYCNVCGKTFRYGATFKQHMKVHTGEKPYKCDICSKGFAQKQQLASHTLTHTGEKKYVCPFCNKAFALNGNLKVHIRRHTGETPFACDVCGKGFYDSSTLKKHMQGQHLDTNVNLPVIKTEPISNSG